MSMPSQTERQTPEQWLDRQRGDRIACGRMLVNGLHGRLPVTEQNLALEAGADRGFLVRAWFEMAAMEPCDDDLSQFTRLWPDPHRFAADVRLERGEPGSKDDPWPTRRIPDPEHLAIVLIRVLAAAPDHRVHAAVAAASIVERWRVHPLADDGLPWWRTVRHHRIVADGTLERWFEDMRVGSIWQRILRRLSEQPAIAPPPELDVLTIAQAAAQLGIAKKTLQNMLSRREIPPACLCGPPHKRLIKAAAFKQWLHDRGGHAR